MMPGTLMLYRVNSLCKKPRIQDFNINTAIIPPHADLQPILNHHKLFFSGTFLSHP
jgi:hypothetical protein